jgi:GNAT superfamily N-acetyltransferase
VTGRAATETLISLEMRSPGQLVPGAAVPFELRPADAATLRSTYVRIGAPHGWTGRTSWTDADWETELALPGVQAWIALVDGQVAGLLELEAEPGGDVGIVVFGLVPEHVGRGLGGALLTRATELAWELAAPGGRVWVQTSSHDHPHALPNYARRSFTVFRSETVARPSDSANPSRQLA